MSWDLELPGRLLGESAIFSAIGRMAGGVPAIHWDARPANGPLPAIVLQVISDLRPQTHDGFDAVRPSRVQVRTAARTRAAAKALGEGAIAALVPAGEFSGVTFLRGFVDAVRGATEHGADAVLFGDLIDLILWHTD